MKIWAAFALALLAILIAGGGIAGLYSPRFNFAAWLLYFGALAGAFVLFLS